MKLRTIWTIPAMDFRERLSRTREWAAIKTAVYLVPRRIKYWVCIVEIGRATKTSENIPATPLDEILRNLSK